MPAVSPAQYGFMASHMDNGGALGKVAKDFVKATPAAKRSSFSKALHKKKKKGSFAAFDKDKDKM